MNCYAIKESSIASANSSFLLFSLQKFNFASLYVSHDHPITADTHHSTPAGRGWGPETHTESGTSFTISHTLKIHKTDELVNTHTHTLTLNDCYSNAAKNSESYLYSRAFSSDVMESACVYGSTGSDDVFCR